MQGFMNHHLIPQKDLKRSVCNRSIEFVVYGRSTWKKIDEEVLVISPTAFIGSIGGSMGLFFGFSLLACCSDIIDKIFLTLCETNQ